MSQKIYFDYGSGWEDVTSYIRDDYSYTLRAASDNYRYAQNVANMTMNMNLAPEIPDGSTAYYFMDDWTTDDGWAYTISEADLPSLRGGVYKNDFVTISGGMQYIIKLKCIADGATSISLVGETPSNTYEVISVATLSQGEGIATFVINTPNTYTGLGFIWDGNVDLEWEWLYVGDGLWISNLDRLRAAGNIKVKIVEDSIQIFQGIIANKPTYDYNGILENVQIALEVTDSIQELDKDIGDVVYWNCKVLDPAHPEASLVHLLASQVGLQVSGDITIADIIPVFAPSSDTDSILSTLDQILYEHKYVLHMNEYDQIEPIQWANCTVSGVVELNDNDIIQNLSITENEPSYKGVQLLWNEMATKSGVLLYQDDLPFDNANGFTGYFVPSGVYYPLEMNVIDEATGDNTLVYQTSQELHFCKLY